MNLLADEFQKAVANLRHTIDASRRFPENVFSEEWDAFFFFDSDWMFEDTFMEKVNGLLKIEGGNCACIAYFDAAEEHMPDSFFIDGKTTGAAYQSFLAGPNIGDGWIYGFGAFGCISDVGQWCFYCERKNEIAVLAFHKNCPLEKYKPLIAQFKALQIKKRSTYRSLIASDVYRLSGVARC